MNTKQTTNKQENWMPTVANYEVSNLGQVRLANTFITVTLNTAANGDLLVEINNKLYLVADLVRAAFASNQEGKLIFIDQNKSNCKLTNLYFRPAKFYETEVFKNSVLKLSLLDNTAKTIAKQLDISVYYVKRIMNANKINSTASSFDKSYAKFKASMVINNDIDYAEALLAQNKLQIQETLISNELNSAVLKHLSELIFNYKSSIINHQSTS
jgi:hypothetical protein